MPRAASIVPSVDCVATLAEGAIGVGEATIVAKPKIVFWLADSHPTGVTRD